MENTLIKHDPYHVIIDTDPGVDDCTCLIFALTDPRIKVDLITIAPGNVPIDQSTNNALAILDLLNVNIPVVKGLNKKMESASFMHGNNAIGGYKTPKKLKHSAKKDADVAEEMYNVLLEYPNQVTLLLCGPCTNTAYLFKKHPDAKRLVKQIIFMGGSPFGLPEHDVHVSFNARTDPEAMKMVLNCGAEVTMLPSIIGRTKANFSEEQVNELASINNLGKFLALTYNIYWEPGFAEKFVSNNDICTYLYLIHPEFFSTTRVSMSINTTTKPGFINMVENEKSHRKVIWDLNRESFLNFVFTRVKELSYLDIKI